MRHKLGSQLGHKTTVKKCNIYQNERHNDQNGTGAKLLQGKQLERPHSHSGVFYGCFCVSLSVLALSGIGSWPFTCAQGPAVS